MSARVEVRGLSHSYSGRPALRDVSLTLEPGTTTTLVGASGSGKTTLLRCLAGLLSPDAGEILFDGRDVTSIPAERRGVGFVFQSYALFPHMSVSENLAFGLDVRKTDAAGRRRRVGELAGELGLEELLERRPAEISGGERQRVALGRALAYRPVLLLLDEPLAALDPNLAESVRDALVRAIGIERTTVLFVTHDQSDALRMGDRVALLREGAIEQSGSPRELYRRPRTEYAANFFGAGAVWEGQARQSGASVVAETPVGPVALAQALPGRVRLVLRPEALSLDESGTPVTVRASSYEGDRSRLVFETGGFQAVVHGPAEAAVAPGDRIRVRVDPSLVILLPPD
ncbi:MAG: ABC transporter ATP-binding protein [Acidobacteriota bacterium]|nr:ABC transporter ATP-binding protein [Acidobacteriota bacterium]